MKNENIPQYFQDREILSASILGFTGSYVFSKGAQLTSRLLSKKWLNIDGKVMPVLEKLATVGLPLIFLSYATIDPEGAKEGVMTQPVYSAGLMSAYLGGLTAVSQDFKRRRNEAHKEYSELTDKLD